MGPDALGLVGCGSGLLREGLVGVGGVVADRAVGFVLIVGVLLADFGFDNRVDDLVERVESADVLPIPRLLGVDGWFAVFWFGRSAGGGVDDGGPSVDAAGPVKAGASFDVVEAAVCIVR